MHYVFVLRIYRESLVDQVYALYYDLLFLKVSGRCSLAKVQELNPKTCLADFYGGYLTFLWGFKKPHLCALAKIEHTRSYHFI